MAILLSQLNYEEITAKILDVDGLPTYEEVMQLFGFLEKEPHEEHQYFRQKSWFAFCNEHWLHNIYNIEFIHVLAGVIKELNSHKTIEVCAGNGKLSHQLKKKGSDIIATDDYSWEHIKRDENLVEKLSHKEALEKYKPDLVIASWIPYKTRIGFDILDFPSVNYFIDMGESVGGATWLTNEIYKREDFEMVYLEKVQEHVIDCTVDPDGIAHSNVILFKRR